VFGSILGLIINTAEYQFCGLLLTILLAAMAKERKPTVKKISSAFGGSKVSLN